MQIAFDGNGRMFVVEAARLLSDPRRHRSDPADRPHVHARGSRQRRRLRAPLRLRRQDGVSAVRDAVRRQHHPDDGDQRGRSVEVHRYQRRRRGRQERAVRHQLRAGGQHGIPAGQPVLGDGQLALQHGERVPAAMDPERPVEGAHRAEQLAVGSDAGQRRQGLVPGRRQRDARLLPVPGPLRHLHAAGSVRTGSEHRVGRADPRRRHPVGHTGDAPARWLADLRDGRGRQRGLSRRSTAEGPDWRLSLRRDGGPYRPPAQTGQDRRPHAAAERLPARPSSSVRSTRCSVPPTRRPGPTGRSTSRTCIAA